MIKNNQNMLMHFLLQIYCCPWFWGFIIKTFEILNGKVVLLIKIILKILAHFGIEKSLRDHLVKTPDFINGATGAQRAGAICSQSHSEAVVNTRR